ncbi:MAG: hypothetical protein ACE5F3_03380 [Mariprofundaceae bacterium]
MGTYLLSLLIYAIPANLIAAAIIFFGRKRVTWLPSEYLFIYSAWLLAIALVIFLFGGLDAAIAELGVRTALLKALLVIGGCMGGITLLPRLFFAKARVHAMVITTISAFLFSTAYIKLVTLIFLFAPSSGQA